MPHKRICLFAAYNPQNQIDDYIIFYLKNLYKFADVFYCADNDLEDAEIDKIRPFTKSIFHGKHTKYDFGSWGRIIDALGWEKINEYDEMFLVNDSCFGPLFPLASVFEKMDGIKCDVWGIAKNKFLMSFFLCIKKSVFPDKNLRMFFKNLKTSEDKNVFLENEKELDKILSKYSTAVFLDKENLKPLYKQNKKFIKRTLRTVFPWPIRWGIRTRVDKIRLYDNEALLLPLLGFPFLKKNAFYNMASLIPAYGLKFVTQCTDYNPELISGTVQKNSTEKPSFRKYVRNRFSMIINRNKRHLLKRFHRNGTGFEV